MCMRLISKCKLDAPIKYTSTFDSSNPAETGRDKISPEPRIKITYIDTRLPVYPLSRQPDAARNFGVSKRRDLPAIPIKERTAVNLRCASNKNIVTHGAPRPNRMYMHLAADTYLEQRKHADISGKRCEGACDCRDQFDWQIAKKEMAL